MGSDEQHLDVVHKYLEIVSLMQEIDMELDTLDERQSDVNTRLSDVLHFIEDYDGNITGKQAQKLFKLIQDLRKIRRVYKQEWEVRQVINAKRTDLGYTNRYSSFIGDLCKKEKELDTKYNPRIWSYKEILGMITEAGGRGRKPKNVEEKV